MSYELIGYIASALVAVSLMMSSILRLRLINLAGALLFAVYGTLIGSIPVAAVNTFIVGVNIFYLVRIFRTEEYFRIVELRPDSEYLRYFVQFNLDDILRFQPEFSPRYETGDLVFVTLRGVVPAGLVIGEPRPDGTLVVHLDYVLPGYRDFKVGGFVFRRHDVFFRDRGIRRIRAPASTRVHARYLRRMGFTPAGSGAHGAGRTYELKLDGSGGRRA
jgi:hypothetical protein